MRKTLSSFKADLTFPLSPTVLWLESYGNLTDLSQGHNISQFTYNKMNGVYAAQATQLWKREANNMTKFARPSGKRPSFSITANLLSVSCIPYPQLCMSTITPGHSLYSNALHSLSCSFQTECSQFLAIYPKVSLYIKSHFSIGNSSGEALKFLNLRFTSSYMYSGCN